MTTAKNDMIRVVIANNPRGSVEHYFHFLLGFCVPLVHFHLQEMKGENDVPLAVRECGPMSRILRELPINLRLFPKSIHAEGLSDLPSQFLVGLDQVERYAYPIFRQFREFIAAHCPDPPSSARPHRLLLVEREPPDSFYATSEAEIKGSGTDRRSIQNHAAIAAWLGATYPNSLNVQLAGVSIYDQFRIFNAADLVVAQHGAALGNIIFMKEGSAVIEIGTQPQKDYFKNLSAVMKVRHRLLESPQRSPLVDLAELSQAVEAMVKH